MAGFHSTTLGWQLHLHTFLLFHSSAPTKSWEAEEEKAEALAEIGGAAAGAGRVCQRRGGELRHAVGEEKEDGVGCWAGAAPRRRQQAAEEDAAEGGRQRGADEIAGGRGQDCRGRGRERWRSGRQRPSVPEEGQRMEEMRPHAAVEEKEDAVGCWADTASRRRQ